MKKALLLMVVVLMVAFAILPQLAMAKDVTLRLAGWQSSPAEREMMEGMLKQFEAENPGIKVKYEIIQDNYEVKIKTMLAAKTAPDVFYADIFWVKPLMKRGVLLSLNKYMPTTGTKIGDFLPSLMEGFTYKGEVYGIPKDFNTLAIFYNKEMFDAAGIAYPSGNWTWDDFRAAAKKLTKVSSDPAKSQYGITLPVDLARLIPFIFQAGGIVINDDDEVSLSLDAATKAFELYAGFQAKDRSSVLPSEVGAGWMGDSFAKGRAGMALEGGWLNSYLKGNFPDLKYGVSELPKGPAGRGNVYFTVSYSASKLTKYPEEAWKLIEFLTNTDNQRKVMEAGFALPTRRALENADYLLKRPEIAAIFKGYAYAKPWYVGEQYTQVTQAIQDPLNEAMLGKISPADAAKQAMKALSRISK